VQKIDYKYDQYCIKLVIQDKVSKHTMQLSDDITSAADSTYCIAEQQRDETYKLFLAAKQEECPETVEVSVHESKKK